MKALCRDCGLDFEQRDPFVVLCELCRAEIERKREEPRRVWAREIVPEAHHTLCQAVRGVYSAIELLDGDTKRQMAVEDAWDALRHVMGWTGRPWEPWSHYDMAVLEDEEPTK
jgi:hypothetical protein